MPRMDYTELDQHLQRERAYGREGVAVEHGGEGRFYTRLEIVDLLRWLARLRQEHPRVRVIEFEDALFRQAADMLARDDAEHFRNQPCKT